MDAHDGMAANNRKIVNFILLAATLSIIAGTTIYEYKFNHIKFKKLKIIFAVASADPISLENAESSRKST